MTSKKPYAQQLPCLKFDLAALVETRLSFASGNRKEGETVHCRVQDWHLQLEGEFFLFQWLSQCLNWLWHCFLAVCSWQDGKWIREDEEASVNRGTSKPGAWCFVLSSFWPCLDSNWCRCFQLSDVFCLPRLSLPLHWGQTAMASRYHHHRECVPQLSQQPAMAFGIKIWDIALYIVEEIICHLNRIDLRKTFEENKAYKLQRFEKTDSCILEAILMKLSWDCRILHCDVYVRSLRTSSKWKIMRWCSNGNHSPMSRIVIRCERSKGTHFEVQSGSTDQITNINCRAALIETN